MRDKAHFEKLLQQHYNATVGFTLAASAVYAARYGKCEAQQMETDEWREIARDLRERYGDELSADEVRQEMLDTVVCSRCGKPLSRDYVYPEEHYRPYEHAGVFVGSGDDDVLCSQCYNS